MNENFNQVELFKNLLTGYNPENVKTNGLKINNDIKMIDNIYKPKEEVVTLVFMYGNPQKIEQPKKQAIYPFLCDL